MNLTFVMFKSDGTRKDFPLSGESIMVGRAEDCDLRVPLLSVSRHHCQVSLSSGGATAKDLGSSNGTYVNNRRIAEEAPLAAGDRIVVGPIVFTVQIDGQPEEIQPVKTKGQKLAEQGQADQQVVDLEAEVIAKGGAHDGPISLDDQDPAVDLDPISALEALATENKKPHGQ